jgi:hypothetical protein
MRDQARRSPFVRNALPVLFLCCLAQACTTGPEDPDSPPPEQPEQPPPEQPPPPPPEQPPPPPVPPTPPVPPPSFLSADEPFQVHGEEEEEEEEEEEAVEIAADLGAEEVALAQPGRADIYEVLGDGKLLELNQFRGLQIIDVDNPDQPARLGHLPMIGEPLELHVAGNQAIAVLDHDETFRSTGKGLEADLLTRTASVLVVDITDRAAPRLVSEAKLTGTVTTSRLLTRNGQPTLYVTFVEDDWFRQPDGTYEQRRGSVVQSFQLVAGELIARTRLTLTGFLGVVHATADTLLVARRPVNQSNGPNDIAIIDIGAADGSMVQRGQVTVNTRVRSMDLRDGLLYAFSGRTPLGGLRNELNVWNVADLDAPVLVDQAIFDQFRQLQATALLGDRAFAITHDYDEQGGKLHTFAIDATGDITAVGALEVASWSDIFHPILGDTRLLGIGNDASAGYERLALTLYDATDPALPEPLLVTAAVTPATGSNDDRSAATSDDRAIAVLEGAVNVQAPTGELETGLVLVPFDSAWYHDDGAYKSFSGVQMFTFSSKTLTRRGTMKHGAEPTRSFLLGDGTVANLSSALLGVFTPDLAAPSERAHVELVDDYVQLVPFGAHRVRVRNDRSYYTGETPEQRYLVEVIPRGAPADSAEPLSSFAVPYEAQVFPLGNVLVAVAERRVYQPDYHFEVVIQTHDLSDPRAPRQLAEIVSSDLPPFGGQHWMLENPRRLHVLQDKLVFAHALTQYPTVAATGIACENLSTLDATCGGEVGCTYPAGAETCFELDTGSYCKGGFALCTELGGGKSDCTPANAIDLGLVDLWCHDVEISHPWNQLTVHVVDLANPAQPTIGTKLTTPENESVVGLVASANQLYATLEQPVTVPDDPRPHARTFLRRIDPSDPEQPVLGEPIDVPGEIIAVQGAVLFTRHQIWGQQFIETAIAQLLLTGNEVQLLGYHRFHERSVPDLRVAQDGLIVAKHGQVWQKPWGEAIGAFDHTLSLLRLSGPPASGQPGLLGFQTLSESTLATEQPLADIIPGRVFLRAFGGRLMIDISNPVHPVLKAFLPLDAIMGAALYQDGKMLVPAGRNGIIEHDLATDNLAP